ncbi:CHAT domain-containing protein [Micromonospora sp. NPDC048169]|uniref:CHAT domain-containing protein n=1 Tax=Micromonospora sp. NPDC048169 TaxID=3154711 RepID=UPI0034009346
MTAGFDEPSIDYQIAWLTEAFERAEGTDRADLAVALAETYTQRAQDNEDPADLTAVVDLFTRLLADHPDDPDTDEWRFELGLAYGRRSLLTDDAADSEQAIAVWEPLRAETAPGSPERALVAAHLAQAHWDSCRLRPDSGPAEIRHAAEAVDELRPDVAGTDSAAFVTLQSGMLHLLLAERLGDTDQLRLGISMLDAALPDATTETPGYPLAAWMFCRAGIEQFLLAGDRAILDRLITEGRRAADTLPADYDLLVDLADAYRLRWEARDDAADLDEAIACLRRAPDDQPAELAAATRAACGELLRLRAVRDDSAADADTAVRLVEEADELAPGQWGQELAGALFARWQISHAPPDLERAGARIDQVLAAGPADPDALMRAHMLRLAISDGQLADEWRREPGRVPASGSRARREVEAARRAWPIVDRHAGPQPRAAFAICLALAEVSICAWNPGALPSDRIVALLDATEGTDGLPPELVDLRNLGRSVLSYAREAGHPGRWDEDGEGFQAALRLARPDAHPEVRSRALGVLHLMLNGVSTRSGDLRALQAAREQLRSLRSPDGEPDRESVLLARLFELGIPGRNPEEVAAEAAELRGLLRDPELPYWARLAMPMAEALADLSAAAGEEPIEPPGVVADGDSRTQSIQMLRLLPAVVSALTRRDVAALRAAAEQLGKLIELLPPDHIGQLGAAVFGGRAELGVAEIDPGDTAAAERGVRHLARAVDLLGGPDHYSWSNTLMTYASALRTANLPGGPRRADSREAGLSALRGDLGQVLVQSGTDDAFTAARDAAGHAVTVATWCRQDTADDDLIAALDAGRGLVLHAAMSSRLIADQLAAAGREDLAVRWQHSAGYGHDRLTGTPLGALPSLAEVPDDLRAQVLRTLLAEDRSGILQPARPAEIRAALAAVEADALVYLVPTTADVSGAAVLVPREGEVDVLALPDLRLDAAAGFGRHTGRFRDAQPAEPSAEPMSIDDICAWAWSSAMGRLVAHAHRWRSGNRPARLVLIPLGLLATVPWHAAYGGDGTTRHYAIEDVVVSYAVSARMFCTSAHFPVRPVRSALVVGDPTGELGFAAAEARAVHAAFYPDGTHLGGDVPGDPEGTATPARVLSWVSSAAPGPSLLHLACHGRVDPHRPADGHLVLAGGVLPARRLLDESRLAELAIERVFLAACTTGVTHTDHDEAFSLSTAFLAAGARTVFGSLWAVPDAETSLLMFIVHHFLNTEGCEPVDALHRAQRWMLDPQRRPPPGMPAELSRQATGDSVARPESWAAFTHSGR